MAHTINLNDDFIAAEELELIKTKQVILEKLRVRFAEFPANDTSVRKAREGLPERISARTR